MTDTATLAANLAAAQSAALTADAATLAAFHAGINSGTYSLGQFIQDVSSLPAQLVVPANIQRATDLATELSGLNSDYANFVQATQDAAAAIAA